MVSGESFSTETLHSFVSKRSGRSNQATVHGSCSGAPSELKIVGHFEVDEAGLISRETAYYDQLAAAVQLGALPDISTARGRLWLAVCYPVALARMIRARLWR